MQRAGIVFNPAAGTQRASRARALESARAILARGGIETVLVETARDPEATAARVRALEGEVDAVVVCGGDGTVNDVVQALADMRASLGILPLGSGNLLAKHFRIPLGIEPAARALLTAQRVEVPLARLESSGREGPLQRFWLAAVGVGVDAKVFSSLKPAVKTRLGAAAYYAAAARHILFSRDPFPPFRVEWTGEQGAARNETVTQLILERIDYFGPCVEPSAATLEPDRLRAVLFKTSQRRAFARYGIRQMANRRWGHRGPVPKVEVVRTRELRCLPADGGGKVGAQLDGEPFGGVPLRAVMTERSIGMLVPGGPTR